MKKILFPLAASLLLMASCTESSTPVADKNLTPTMGWSSWNTYGININEQLIREQADAMANTPLKDAGYEYINIDDGYFGNRDSVDGHLLIHPEKFPNGLRPLVDYIHGLGLKAGIYTDAGDNTCASKANDIMIHSCDYLIAYAWHPASNARDLVEKAQRLEKQGGIKVENLAEDRLRSRLDCRSPHSSLQSNPRSV